MKQTRPPLQYGPEHYDRIRNDGATLTIRPARIVTPAHTARDGLVLTAGGQARLVLTLEDAYELAESLANQLDSLAGVDGARQIKRHHSLTAADGTPEPDLDAYLATFTAED
ncbi:hypothetical protein OOZ51_02590 [Arthrobacter sp. MI7-26]|uniref:hypothetical protein n=1 Tax=Arthrobacter sp. MI7-26 TaxID=2993653 RepID=UPI002248B7CB|nr:hypothetical protein [Arthrobacter sp. MI7-26]MCX2746700.1 hypothetical protein [Arthrobacter sp. MI7-26]